MDVEFDRGNIVAQHAASFPRYTAASASLAQLDVKTT
jgi:hypothetical protein